MIEDRFESYVYQIMKYVKYQENKPYIESILEDMQHNLFKEDRLYIKELQQRIDKAIEYINKRMVHEGEYYIRKAYHFRNTEYGKDLLQILGDNNDKDI